MKDNSETRGSSNVQDRGDNSNRSNDQRTNDQRGNEQRSHDQSQMKGGKPGSPQEGQHTNAGNTGSSSGQISPSTQHSSSGKPSGGSQPGSSGTNQNR
jgi:hypothetical protein